jgi:hypothetical protein
MLLTGREWTQRDSWGTPEYLTVETNSNGETTDITYSTTTAPCGGSMTYYTETIDDGAFETTWTEFPTTDSLWIPGGETYEWDG